jgi:hypothetical protein
MKNIKLLSQLFCLYEKAKPNVKNALKELSK